MSFGGSQILIDAANVMNVDRISNAERLLTVLRCHFTNAELAQSGAILYSTESALREAPVIVFGTNPGGASEEYTDAVHLIGNAVFSTQHELTIGWRSDGTYTPLQTRLRSLLGDLLGIDDLASILYTNLIFQRTANISKLDWSLADKCWPVNELILGIVRPRLVICIGNARRNSPYAYLKKIFKGDAEQSAPANFGRYQLRYAAARQKGGTVGLLGLPHLSRYPITGPGFGAARSWVRARAVEAGVID